MNKFEEALKEALKEAKKEIEKDLVRVRCLILSTQIGEQTVFDREDIDTLRESIRRATPIKIKYKESQRNAYGNLRARCKCGALLNNVVFTGYEKNEKNKVDFCYFCGQKIEWSNDNVNKTE